MLLTRRPDHRERQKQMSTDNKTKELSMMDCTHAFAVPGESNIIELITWMAEKARQQDTPGRARFAAYRSLHGKYLAASRPMTISEARAIIA